jgi:glycine/D-amino acid oxidase-like deaminating enzyme
VNATAGRELKYRDARPPQGERIAIIGAGPAGLTYASLVADTNRVTVFEKSHRPGGAFRYAGKAPMFQEVKSNERAFEVYIASLVAICESKNVEFRFNQSVTADLLTDFDRVIVATGAKYRLGLGPLVRSLLDLGAARWPLVAQLFSNSAGRDWFYHKARVGTGYEIARLARPGQKVVAIGDALRAGKSMPAIASAFEAALLSHE